MKKLYLKRSYLPDRTVGFIATEKEEYKTLELPWRQNTPSKSCIPEGSYLVKRDHTGRHQFYAITNVPDRTFIEMHEAYKPSHLLGCVGLGTNFTSEYGLVHSDTACANFVEEMGEDDFILVITKFNPDVDDFC